MDLVCGVCLEPSDSHHVNHDMPLWQSRLFKAGKGCDCCHGVRQKGVTPEMAGAAVLNDVDDEEKFHRIEIACADDVDFSAEWEKPDPMVVAECAGCGARAELDQDDIYPRSRNGKQVGQVVIWEDRRQGMSVTDPRLRHDVPLDEIGLEGEGKKWVWSQYDEYWEFTRVKELGDKVLCPECWTTCDGETEDGPMVKRGPDGHFYRAPSNSRHCNAAIYAGDAQSKFCSDSYDEGNSFYDQDSGNTYCVACFESRPHCAMCEMYFEFGTELSEDGLCEDCDEKRSREEDEDEEDGFDGR